MIYSSQEDENVLICDDRICKCVHCGLLLLLLRIDVLSTMFLLPSMLQPIMESFYESCVWLPMALSAVRCYHVWIESITHVYFPIDYPWQFLDALFMTLSSILNSQSGMQMLVSAGLVPVLTQLLGNSKAVTNKVRGWLCFDMTVTNLDCI